MADKTLFSRLQKLFSSDVIIRNVGGKQLKVADTQRIQSSGGLETNFLVDRFTKLHSANKPLGGQQGYGGSGYGRGMAGPYLASRMELMADYDTMDTDSICAAALDIYSDETTVRGETGYSLTIKTENEKIMSILKNLFYDILNIEFNLWPWVRGMAKYGDFYLKLDISEKYGIINVHPISSYEILREEGFDPSNPGSVQFRVQNAAQVQTRIGPNSDVYQNYEIAHFRLLSDSNFLPYGRSMLEPARKLWKQLCLRGDSKIWTPRGYVEIKDIKPNQEVYCHDYKTGDMLKTTVVKSGPTGEDDIYEVRTAHRRLHANSKHPIMTSTGDFKKIYELTLEDYIITPSLKQYNEKYPELRLSDDILFAKLNMEGIQVASEKIGFQDDSVQCLECDIKFEKLAGTHLSNRGLTPTSYKEKWDTGTELYPEDYFLTGKKVLPAIEAKKICNDLGISETYLEYYPFASSQKILNEKVLEENFNMFVRFLGFMLGGGWLDHNNNTVCFSLGDRRDKSDKYVDFIKTIGLTPLVRYDDTTRAVCVIGSKYFLLLLEQLGFKTGTNNKVVPKWIYDLNNDFQREFLEGFADAAGCVIRNGWQVGGINKYLIEELHHLAQRNGYYVSNIVKHSGGKKGTWDFAFTFTSKSNRTKKISNDINIERVLSITKVGHEQVYDLQVESELHNFIADGLVVHNTLMEDAMLIHRIMRAPEKRIFKIDIGNIPPAQVDEYMRQVMDKMKKTPYINTATGDYNLKYNMMNITEDFYLPVRAGDSATSIETTKGLDFNAIEDIDYLKNKLFAALKIPKAFLGFDDKVCVVPETKIPLLDGTEKTMFELINEYERGIKNYVYSIDEKTKNIVPGEIEWVGWTRENAELVRVHLDNTNYIDCTPDHLFMLRDGSWSQASNLNANDSLMPIYFEKTTEKHMKDYTTVYNPSKGKYEPVHRMVANYFGLKNSGKVIHHKDLNKWNNNPENLDCNMTHVEHNIEDKYEFIQKHMPLARANYGFINNFKSTVLNHKVIRVEYLTDRKNTCDLRIKKYHNFATSAGVIIHNSGKATLAAEDVRFARTIDRIQRIVESELYKIAVIHLYSQGFDDADLVDFSLQLTNPSTIYEQEKLAIFETKIKIAGDLKDANLLSTDWVYKNIFNMSDDDANEQREKVSDDVRRKFKLKQMEEEGNDPEKTGRSFGTAHDLASMNIAGREYSMKNNEKMPPTKDSDGENVKFGATNIRSHEKGGAKNLGMRYGQDSHPRGRDPLGQDSYFNHVANTKITHGPKPNYTNRSPFPMESLLSELRNIKTKQIIKDSLNIEDFGESKMLDESNLNI